MTMLYSHISSSAGTTLLMQRVRQVIAHITATNALTRPSITVSRALNGLRLTIVQDVSTSSRSTDSTRVRAAIRRYGSLDKRSPAGQLPRPSAPDVSNWCVYTFKYEHVREPADRQQWTSKVVVYR